MWATIWFVECLYSSGVRRSELLGLTLADVDLENRSLRVIGGTPGYTAAQSAGQLPAGLTLNGGTLVVSGTPAESGFFNATLVFTDTSSQTLRVTNYVSISNGTSPIVINTGANLGTATVGVSATFTLQASNTQCCVFPNFTWSAIGFSCAST